MSDPVGARDGRIEAQIVEIADEYHALHIEGYTEAFDIADAIRAALRDDILAAAIREAGRVEGLREAINAIETTAVPRSYETVNIDPGDKVFYEVQDAFVKAILALTKQSAETK